MAIQALTIPSAHAVEATAKAVLELVINSPDSKSEGEEMLVAVSTAGRNLEHDEEILKRPHLDALDEIRAVTRPYKELLNTRRKELSDKLIIYDNYCEKEAARKQALENKRYEEKVQRAEEKAELLGKPVPIIPPPPVIAPPPNTSVTSSGAQLSKRVTRDWQLPVIIFNGRTIAIDRPEHLTYADVIQYKLRIDPKYFVLDTARVGRVIRSGEDILGIETITQKGLSVKQGS